MSPSQPTSLPPSQSFLTSLLSPLSNSSNIPSSPFPPTINPTLSPTTKPTLLTLHALFPTLLLPALDLLDRRLITRFILQEAPTDRRNDAEVTIGVGRGTKQNNRLVYYVKSNAHSRYGRSGDVGGTSYEVRMGAWSCTCAAFAFSAYNDGGRGSTCESYEDVDEFVGCGVGGDGDEGMVDVSVMEGNVARNGDGLMVEDEEMPLCKHLLACVLVEKWDVGGGMLEERMVGREEMAGWAAGWGG